jgi:hypothetical protein
MSEPVYIYDEEHDEGYYKIICEDCDRETTISEEHLQRCMDNGHDPICHRCMWGDEY